MVTDRVPLFGESHKHVSDKEEKKKEAGSRWVGTLFLPFSGKEEAIDGRTILGRESRELWHISPNKVKSYWKTARGVAYACTRACVSHMKLTNGEYAYNIC